MADRDGLGAFAKKTTQELHRARRRLNTQRERARRTLSSSMLDAKVCSWFEELNIAIAVPTRAMYMMSYTFWAPPEVPVGRT